MAYSSDLRALGCCRSASLLLPLRLDGRGGAMAKALPRSRSGQRRRHQQVSFSLFGGAVVELLFLPLQEELGLSG